MNDLLVAQQARPFRLVLIRLTVMAILAAATCLTLRLTGAGNDFPPLDALYFPFVNIVCGVVIWRTFRRYRVSVRDYLGIEGRRLGGDIAWGFLWVVVAYIPMMIVIMISMYSLFGADMFQHFEGC